MKFITNSKPQLIGNFGSKFSIFAAFGLNTNFRCRMIGYLVPQKDDYVPAAYDNKKYTG